MYYYDAHVCIYVYIYITMRDNVAYEGFCALDYLYTIHINKKRSCDISIQ